MSEPTVGVTFRPQSPPERLHDVVQVAEAAGIDELWLWEDCFFEGGLTTASAALAWSAELHVGIGLMPVPLRNPALMAMEIATLARMFPGRFLPGLGHGVLDWMKQVGAGAPSPMTLLREYTVAVRGLLHGKTVHADGKAVHLDGVALDWPPQQVPPLLVGGRGPKTLRLAGELADGVLLDEVTTPEKVRAAVDIVEEGAAAAGRTTPPRVVVYVEIDARTPDLTAQVAGAVSTYAAVGAHSVIFQSVGEAPDPEPLIAALAAR